LRAPSQIEVSTARNERAGCDDEAMLRRFKDLLGLGPPDAYPSEMSRSARLLYAVFLFIWMTVAFAGFDAFGSDQTFIESLPSAAVAGLVTVVIATLLMPRFVRRFGRR